MENQNGNFTVKEQKSGGLKKSSWKFIGGFLLIIIIVFLGYSLAKGAKFSLPFFSSVGGIFASAKDVLGSAFFSEDEFQQLGEMDIDNNNGDNNSISVSSNNQTSKSVQPKTADIIITEIMYDPQGADSGREWIEIHNNDDSVDDLTGWKFFENDTNHNSKAIRGSNIIKPFEYAVIVDDADKFLKDYPQYQGTIFESSFSLKNSGETIAIKSGDVKIDEVNYKTSAGANGNGNSLQLLNRAWQEFAPTPGKPNVAVNKVSLSDTAGKTDDVNVDKNNEASEESNTQTPKSNFISCGFTSSQPPNRPQIIISEVAWMGMTNSANDEWIELKNIASQEIDLTDWQLLNKNESIKINFNDLKNAKIKPGQFLLLERTDDSSAGPAADLIYTGALSNKDDGLKLFDSQCVLMDEVLANPNNSTGSLQGWPAGDNNSKKTMERDLSGFSWHTSVNIGGTPKKENSQGSISYQSGSSGGSSGGGSSASVLNSSNISDPPQFYPFLITEIMYNPDGADDGREWVEIYNNGTSTVDITSWKFFESDTNHNLTLIKGQAKIAGGEYAVIANDDEKFLIDFPDYQGALFKSSFSLNNDGEILVIKNSDLKIDEVNYKSQWGADGNGKSLQLINGQWQEAVPTPGKENSTSQTNSNQPPIAVFNFSPLNPTVNQAITFNAGSSTDSDNSISFYEWNFGDNDLVSSTEVTTEYIYATPGSYNIELKVFDAAGLYSIATSTISICPSQNQNQNSEILISEIVYDGSGSDDGKEFIELYNASLQKDLNGWSLKYQKASSSKLTTLAVFGSQPQDATVIAEKRFLLIGLNSYDSANYSGINSDVKRSVSLPNGAISDTPITIFLFDENGKEISRAVYDFDSAQNGKSWERKVLDSGSGNCEISQGNYEFNGNDCNKDNNQADFSARDIPNPQNSQNLPEPRQKPTTPADFNIVFDSAESKLNLSWTASTDSTGNSETIVYKIKDISSSTILLLDIETSSTSTVIPISELERNYKFSLQAFDKDGLWSELAEKEILVSNNSSVGTVICPDCQHKRDESVLAFWSPI